MLRAPRKSQTRAIAELRGVLDQVLEVVQQFGDASRVQQIIGLLRGTDKTIENLRKRLGDAERDLGISLQVQQHFDQRCAGGCASVSHTRVARSANKSRRSRICTICSEK
jgi:hypothetical protein